MTPRYFRVDRRQHAYLTFIVESYEGICTVSTVDNAQGIIRVLPSEGQEQDLEGLPLNFIGYKFCKFHWILSPAKLSTACLQYGSTPSKPPSRNSTTDAWLVFPSNEQTIPVYTSQPFLPPYQSAEDPQQ